MHQMCFSNATMPWYLFLVQASLGTFLGSSSCSPVPPSQLAGDTAPQSLSTPLESRLTVLLLFWLQIKHWSQYSIDWHPMCFVVAEILPVGADLRPGVEQSTHHCSLRGCGGGLGNVSSVSRPGIALLQLFFYEELHTLKQKLL